MPKQAAVIIKPCEMLMRNCCADKNLEINYLGLITGIKAGYKYSIKNNKWKADNDDNSYKANELPPYANNVFYVTLSLGGGSFDKK